MRRFVALCVLSIFCAAPIEAQAGFFDFLFGGARPAPSPAPNYDQLNGNGAGLKAHRHVAKRPAAPKATEFAGVARGGELESIRRLTDILNSEGPRAAFLQDPTLKSGDIVVTSTGFEIFDGSRGSTHERNQFRPLARSIMRGRSDLAQMERTSRIANFGKSTPLTAEPRTLTVTRSNEKDGSRRTGADGNSPIANPAP